MDLRLRALKRLDPADRRLAEKVTRRLKTIWLSERYLIEAVKELNALIPAAACSIYTRRPDGGLGEIGHTIVGDPSDSWTPLHNAGRILPQAAQYPLDRKDPFANRPVNTATLFGHRPKEELELFREGFLAPIGLHHQLRTTIYDGSSFVAHSAFLGERSRGDFDRREADLFAAVLPVLCDGLVTLRAIGGPSMAKSDLGGALDLFEEPAYLLTDNGAVVYANQSARQALPIIPDWLSSVGQRPASGCGPRLARTTQIRVARKNLRLVVPSCRVGEYAPPSLLDALPPSLRSVAELLAAGLSDKEIAASTGHTLATVRTYVTRLFSRTGVHSRAELVCRLHSAR